tara:strand:+ start:128 stop:430 length:303 start_codon:yes stop_codon:yes gene_type:complete
MNTLKEIKNNISKKDVKKYISTGTNRIQKTRFFKTLNGWQIIVETKQDISKSNYIHTLSYFDIQSVKYKDGFLHSTQFCKNPKAIVDYINYLKNFQKHIK